jgi:DinB family protein
MLNPYATHLGQANAREVVKQTPAKLAAIIQKMGPAVEKIPAPGKWSPRMILCHLADGEMAFGFRLRQTLAEPNHVIQPFDQDAWAKPYGSASLSAQAALEMFSVARRWNVALLETLSAEDLKKPVTHPERGTMTFETIVETMAGHDLNHIAQLEKLG